MFSFFYEASNVEVLASLN